MFRAHHSHSGSAQSGSELQVPPQASFGVSAALIGPRRGDGGAGHHRHCAQGLSDFTRTSHTATLNICRGAFIKYTNKMYFTISSCAPLRDAPLLIIRACVCFRF